MSAFIVSDSTINAPLSWISMAYRDRNFSNIASYLLPEAGYDIKDDPEALPRLAAEMFALNVDAVNHRYPPARLPVSNRPLRTRRHRCPETVAVLALPMQRGRRTRDNAVSAHAPSHRRDCLRDCPPNRSMGPRTVGALDKKGAKA